MWKRGTLKTLRHRWRNLKTQINGKIFWAHEWEELVMLKCPFYPKQYAHSIQFPSKFQGIFCQKLRKTILTFARNHKGPQTAKRILGKENSSWRKLTHWLETTLRRYRNHTLETAQRETHGPEEQRSRERIAVLVSWGHLEEFLTVGTQSVHLFPPW